MSHFDTVLPGRHADLADAIVDAVRLMLDREPEDAQPAISAAIDSGAYDYIREPGDPAVPTDGGRVVIRFHPPIERQYIVPLVRIGPRRVDA